MTKIVDSYKFLDYLTRKVIQLWVEMAAFPEDIP